MENKKQNTILKAIVLSASWLTLSPLMLTLDGRWQLLPKWLRITLFMVSPLMLIALNLILVLADFATTNLFHQKAFTSPRAIEKITGVRFPEYKTIDYNSPRYGHGPIQYNKVLEFDDVPDESFYKALEEHGDYNINEDDTLGTYHFKKPYHYFSLSYAYYYDFWTYGDVFVTVKKGSKIFEVTLFEWPDHNLFFKDQGRFDPSGQP